MAEITDIDPHTLQEICAWVLTDSKGHEGLVTLEMPNKQTLTLMGNREQVLEFLEQVQEVSNGSKCKVRLVRFASREVLQTVEPKLISVR